MKHDLWAGLFMAAGVVAIRYASALPLLADVAVSFVGFTVIALGVVVVVKSREEAPV